MTRLCYTIPASKTLRGNFILDGWDLTKWKHFLTTRLLSLRPLMMKKQQFLPTVIVSSCIEKPLPKEDFLSHIVSGSYIGLIKEEEDPSPPLSG